MAKIDTADKVFLGIVCFTICLFLAFWGAVGYIVLHFIAKLW